MLDDPLRCLPRPFLALASVLGAPGAHSAYDVTRRDPQRPPCVVEPPRRPPASPSRPTTVRSTGFGIVELEGQSADEPLLREFGSGGSLAADAEWFVSQGIEGLGGSL